MIIVNDTIEKYNHLQNIAKKTLDLIISHASEAQILIRRSVSININTRYGDLENIEFNNDSILEITIFHKKRKVYVTSRNLKEENIIDLISKAMNMINHIAPDPYTGLANKLLLAYQGLDLDLFHPTEFDIKNITGIVAQTEKVALKYDKRIIHTEGANFNSCTTSLIIANTHGMLQGYNSTQYSLACGVIAESNNGYMERNHAYTINRKFKKLQSPEKIGKECAKRTLKRINSRKIITTESPILFSSEIAASLFKHLIDALNGENVYRKSTFLLYNLGKIIFPNWLCIQERPHILGEIASFPFDDEGIKTINRTIIKNGMLCTWLLDSYSASKLGINSTGHANNVYNWYVNHKNINFSEIIKKMNTGLIVTDLMGQGINIVTGDYSRGASGFWVERGEIQFPVSEITISGNLKNMFLNITCIGNDIEYRSNIKCGSVLISSIKISGR